MSGSLNLRTQLRTIRATEPAAFISRICDAHDTDENPRKNIGAFPTQPAPSLVNQVNSIVGAWLLPSLYELMRLNSQNLVSMI
ncbi:hypothetical protein VTI28DRAFT_3071 [Corynascus sepedonium]